ncbi:MAG: alpha/beta hydrolase [Pseudomonadales bacterium]|jgi:pimeloyl-ACP methyl ester carboxylesterase|nr:alpha/beta hydrolase [Pseudomonadales bacterium]MDP7597199.1 alpha/beta hydrolase [Pseudomonadales bacterium]HJN51899.1 alpha/beta hydrolase [Pseudomonadales bacterium]|tara:strand:+ start:1344 stop:2153 length:810 start_codon:yes stop_codon:yes gene_type:complete
MSEQATSVEKPTKTYFTVSDGIKIHYMQLGSAGSHVVLIHGYTGNAYGNWYANGIMQALAKNHRVTALDCRNHGRSDKPQPGGPGQGSDVIELMDHLEIDIAHIHGYSMGGGITAQLLANDPERFITAGFGGSGIREADPKWIEKIPEDKTDTNAMEAVASRGLRINAAMDRGMTREDAEKAADAPRSPRNRPARAPLDIDLGKVKIPILAINGEFDNPHVKTFRLWRELDDFTNVILPGKSHLTAIAPDYMPREYLDSLVRFVDGNDV